MKMCMHLACVDAKETHCAPGLCVSPESIVGNSLEDDTLR